MNLLPAFGLGAVTGIRSMMGLAFFSDHADEMKDESNPALDFLKRPRVAALLKIMAAGEVVMDKLPFIPARTEVAPLIGRIVIGGLVGAAISKEKWIQGGAVGAVGALASTYAITYLRKTLHDDRHIPDVVLGVAEDALVVKASDAIVAQYETR
jgi:uncharacterized membrane protein